jgi:iron complex outermembrane receptor protein
LKASAVFFVVLLAVARTASAQEATDPQQLTDLSLEDLLKLKVNTVYSASKFEQEIVQAPATVSIVTAEEIRNHGYRTLADILRSVRGFYVSYDRNYSYVGVRGFQRPGDYNGRILLLVNGHQLNDTIFESALLGTESPIDISVIERVEVVRGPSSSLYGTSAFFGVVNLITKTGRTQNGLTVEMQGASQMFRRGNVTAGGQTASGVDGFLSVSSFASRGNRNLYYPEFDAPETNHGVVADADGDRATSVFGSASARGFELQGGFGSRLKTIPTAAFETTFNDARTQTRDRRGFVDLRYTHPVSTRTTLQSRVSFDHYDYDGTYAYSEGLFLDGGHATWVTGEGVLVRRFDRNNLTTGVEYRKNLRLNQDARQGSAVLLDDRRRLETAAVYAEDEVRLNSHLIVNGGVRWDEYFDTFGGTLNPRLGVIVSPAPGAALKLLYGRAFRAPNPYELYYEQDAVSAALRPERIATRELAWEQHVTSRFQVTASLFNNRVRDVITREDGSPSSTDGLFYQNSEDLTASGVEVEVQTMLPGRVGLRIADAFQSSSNQRTRGGISNSPGQLATVVLDAPLGRSAIVLGFNSWYISERHTVTGSRVAPSFVSDVTLSRSAANRRLSLSLSVHNLFDAVYGDPASEEHRQQVIPQDGRTAALRLTWRLR